MRKTVLRLNPKFIDAFVLMRETSKRNCSFQGCTKRRRVIVKWRADQREREQQADAVCFEHALYLANQVLSVRKFGKEYK